MSCRLKMAAAAVAGALGWRYVAWALAMIWLLLNELPFLGGQR